MALILLIVIGALCGWLFTVHLRVEQSGAILTYAAIGAGGSLIAGLIGNRGSMIEGLSLIAFVAALAGAAAALAFYQYYFLKRRQG